MVFKKNIIINSNSEFMIDWLGFFILSQFSFLSFQKEFKINLNKKNENRNKGMRYD